MHHSPGPRASPVPVSLPSRLQLQPEVEQLALAGSSAGSQGAGTQHAFPLNGARPTHLYLVDTPGAADDPHALLDQSPDHRRSYPHRGSGHQGHPALPPLHLYAGTGHRAAGGEGDSLPTSVSRSVAAVSEPPPVPGQLCDRVGVYLLRGGDAAASRLCAASRTAVDRVPGSGSMRSSG